MIELALASFMMALIPVIRSERPFVRRLRFSPVIVALYRFPWAVTGCELRDRSDIWAARHSCRGYSLSPSTSI